MAVNKKSKDNSAGTTNANSVSQKTSISSWVRNRPTAHPASVCAGSAIGVHYRANVGSCQQRLLSEIKCCLYSRVAPSGFSDFSKQNGHEAIFNLEFSPNGDVLVAACEENSMLLFDPLTTKHITAVRNAHSDCVNCIRFLDSRTFASGSDDSTIALWDIRNLKQKIRCLQGHTNWVKSIEYCRQTRRLVTSAFDGNVVTWDINGYEEKGTPHEKVFYIESLMRTRLTPDCTKLVMSTARGFYIIVHDLNLSTLNSDLAGLDFARHYQGVGLGEEPSEFDGELGLERIWQGRRRGRNRVELVSDFPDGSKASCISSLVVHPQGWAMMSRYTTRDNDAEWTCVHDLQDPVPEASHGDTVMTRPPAKRLMYYTKEPTDGQGYIKELSVSPDGRLICSSYGFGVRLLAFDDKSSELCDIQPHTVRELRQVKFLVRHKSTVLTSRFSPTHCLLVSGSMCGRVAFYQPKL